MKTYVVVYKSPDGQIRDRYVTARNHRKAIPMAARAVSFYCSPDTAAMFSGGERGVGNGNTTISKEV